MAPLLIMRQTAALRTFIPLNIINPTMLSIISNVVIENEYTILFAEISLNFSAIITAISVSQFALQYRQGNC
jgi:hypothetical protein